MVTELSTTGFRAGTHNTHVYVSGTEIAVYDSWLNQVLTKLSDPVVGRGLDPLGGYVGFVDPFVQNPNTTYDSLHPGEALYFQDANPFDPGSGCEVDGLPTDCSRLARQLENGTVGIQFGAGGKIYNVSNFFGFSGGMWVSVPTPSDPTSEPMDYDGHGPMVLNVEDNAYMSVWMPFGGAQNTSNLPSGHVTLQNVVGLQPRIPSPSSPTQIPIWCNSDVIKAMNRAWGLSGNAGQIHPGSNPIEAGFNLNGSPKIPKVSGSFTNEVGHMTIHYQGNTFANFHIHPLGSDGNNGFPSTPESNYERNGKGDTGAFDRIYKEKNQAIQVYVMSWKGLAMYDPVTKQARQLVKGTGFLRGEGCPP